MQHTFEQINGMLRLDVTTGKLYWRYDRGRARKGTEAGCLNDRGYVIIEIEDIRYKAHRIVWLLFTGEWPVNDIDHINRIKNDNRPVNLRDVERLINVLNSPRYDQIKERRRASHS